MFEPTFDCVFLCPCNLLGVHPAAADWFTSISQLSYIPNPGTAAGCGGYSLVEYDSTLDVCVANVFPPTEDCPSNATILDVDAVGPSTHRVLLPNACTMFQTSVDIEVQCDFAEISFPALDVSQHWLRFSPKLYLCQLWSMPLGWSGTAALGAVNVTAGESGQILVLLPSPSASEYTVEVSATPVSATLQSSPLSALLGSATLPLRLCSSITVETSDLSTLPTDVLRDVCLRLLPFGPAPSITLHMDRIGSSEIAALSMVAGNGEEVLEVSGSEVACLGPFLIEDLVNVTAYLEFDQPSPLVYLTITSDPPPLPQVGWDWPETAAVITIWSSGRAAAHGSSLGAQFSSLQPFSTPATVSITASALSSGVTIFQFHASGTHVGTLSITNETLTSFHVCFGNGGTSAVQLPVRGPSNSHYEPLLGSFIGEDNLRTKETLSHSAPELGGFTRYFAPLGPLLNHLQPRPSAGGLQLYHSYVEMEGVELVCSVGHLAAPNAACISILAGSRVVFTRVNFILDISQGLINGSFGSVLFIHNSLASFVGCSFEVKGAAAAIEASKLGFIRGVQDASLLATECQLYWEHHPVPGSPMEVIMEECGVLRQGPHHHVGVDRTAVWTEAFTTTVMDARIHGLQPSLFFTAINGPLRLHNVTFVSPQGNDVISAHSLLYSLAIIATRSVSTTLAPAYHASGVTVWDFRPAAASSWSLSTCTLALESSYTDLNFALVNNVYLEPPAADTYAFLSKGRLTSVAFSDAFVTIEGFSATAVDESVMAATMQEMEAWQYRRVDPSPAISWTSSGAVLYSTVQSSNDSVTLHSFMFRGVAAAVLDCSGSQLTMTNSAWEGITAGSWPSTRLPQLAACIAAAQGHTQYASPVTVIANPSTSTTITESLFMNIITAGPGGAVIFISEGGKREERTPSLVVSNTIIHGTSASGPGGALYVSVQGRAAVSIHNSSIASTLGSTGGGIYFSASMSAATAELLLANTTVFASSARINGGAIAVLGDSSNGRVALHLVSSILEECTADSLGGAVYMSGSNAEGTFSKFGAVNTRATTAGGGVALLAGSLEVLYSLWLSNEADAAQGGVLYAAEGAQVTLQEASLQDSRAPTGGALYCSNCTLALVYVEVAGGSAHYGAGIMALDASMSLEGCNVAHNTAAGCGGGLSSTRSTLVIAESNITMNVAGECGAGIYAFASNIDVRNATMVSGNVVPHGRGRGSACYLYRSGQLHVDFSSGIRLNHALGYANAASASQPMVIVPQWSSLTAAPHGAVTCEGAEEARVTLDAPWWWGANWPFDLENTGCVVNLWGDALGLSSWCGSGHSEASACEALNTMYPTAQFMLSQVSAPAASFFLLAPTGGQELTIPFTPPLPPAAAPALRLYMGQEEVLLFSIDNGTLRFPSLPGTGRNLSMWLFVQGQRPFSVPIATYSYTSPVVTAITPTVIPRSGGSIIITGDSFGTPRATDIIVVVGPLPCQDAVVVNNTIITCVAPPGVGKDLAVTVTIGGQASAALSVLQADVPQAVSIPQIEVVKPAPGTVPTAIRVFLSLLNSDTGGSSITQFRLRVTLRSSVYYYTCSYSEYEAMGWCEIQLPPPYYAAIVSVVAAAVNAVGVGSAGPPASVVAAVPPSPLPDLSRVARRYSAFPCDSESCLAVSVAPSAVFDGGLPLVGFLLRFDWLSSMVIPSDIIEAEKKWQCHGLLLQEGTPCDAHNCFVGDVENCDGDITYSVNASCTDECLFLLPQLHHRMPLWVSFTTLTSHFESGRTVTAPDGIVVDALVDMPGPPSDVVFEFGNPTLLRFKVPADLGVHGTVVPDLIFPAIDIEIYRHTWQGDAAPVLHDTMVLPWDALPPLEAAALRTPGQEVAFNLPQPLPAGGWYSGRVALRSNMKAFDATMLQWSTPSQPFVTQFVPAAPIRPHALEVEGLGNGTLVMLSTELQDNVNPTTATVEVEVLQDEEWTPVMIQEVSVAGNTMSVDGVLHLPGLEAPSYSVHRQLRLRWKNLAGWSPWSLHATVTLTCAIGRGYDDMSQACLVCGAGEFSHFDGDEQQPVCELCPAGTSQPEVAALECFLCPAGWVAASPGTSRCTQCPPRTYQGEEGKAACVPCPPGTYNEVAGATACIPCPQRGVQCLNGELTALPGYWQPAWSRGAPVNEDSEFFPCVDEAVCLPPEPNSTRVCAEGHDGPLCASCSPGFAHLGSACSPCWSTSVNLLSLMATILLLLGLSVFLIWRNRKGRSETSIMIRIALNYLQMLWITGEFRLRGPALFREIVGYAAVSNGVSLDISFVQCTLGWSFDDQLLAYALLPLIVVGGVAIGIFTHRLLRRLWRTLRRSKRNHSGPSAPLFNVGLFICSALVLLIMLHARLTTALLSGLQCHPEPLPQSDGSAIFVLKADLTQPCLDTTRLTLAVLGIVVYVLGIPVAAVLLLRPHRNLLKRQSTVLRQPSGSPEYQKLMKVERTFSFFYSGYALEKGLWWWEGLVLLRKVRLGPLVYCEQRDLTRGG